MIKKDEGFLLIMVIILLAAFSLIGATLVNLSTTEKLIHYNSLNKKRVDDAISSGFERIINDIGNFTNPSQKVYTINNVTVTISAPSCIGIKNVGGYSANSISPKEFFWSINGVGTDNITEARSEATIGIRMRMVGDSCPS
jgi:hypothetical protein